MNVIEYDRGVIGLTPNLSAYVQNLITISIDNSEYEVAHKLIDVLSIIRDCNCLMDMHGLVYWAKHVKDLRNQIKELL